LPNVEKLCGRLFIDPTITGIPVAASWSASFHDSAAPTMMSLTFISLASRMMASMSLD